MKHYRILREKVKMNSPLKTIENKKRLKFFVFLGGIGFLLFLLLIVENILLSVILAYVITYMFKPMIDFIERQKVDRTLSVILVFLPIGLLMTLGIAMLFPIFNKQFTALQNEFPNYILGLQNLMIGFQSQANTFLNPFYQLNIAETLLTQTENWVGATLAHIPKKTTQIFTIFLLAPFFSFFMLKDGRSLYRKSLVFVPNNLFEPLLSLTYQINNQMGSFIRARLFEAGIVGLVVWIGLSIISFPFAIILALFASLTNLIPYIGPIIGAIPALAIALINQESWVVMTLIVSIYFIAQLIDILFIIPLVVAKIVDLHPITVIVAIIVGAQAMGVLGMIISIPVTSILKLTFFELYQHLEQTSVTKTGSSN